MSLKSSMLRSVSLLALASCALSAHAGFLDVTSISAGANGSFVGTLNGIGVTGGIVVPDATENFTINDVTDPTYEGSTIDGTSPQYSYSSVYAETAAGADRLGYTLFDGDPRLATFTITFDRAVVDPIFHIANLDNAVFDFSATTSAANLSILKGNGGGGDGLSLVGTALQDANPSTFFGVDPATAPPTSGERSAYGSLLISGAYTSLTFVVYTNPNARGGDGGNFTLSAAPAASPVPGPVAALPFALLALKRRKRA